MVTYYEKNKDKVKKYYEDNKDKIKEYNKQYNINHKEDRKKRNDKQRSSNKPIIRRTRKILLKPPINNIVMFHFI